MPSIYKEFHEAKPNTSQLKLAIENSLPVGLRPSKHTVNNRMGLVFSFQNEDSKVSSASERLPSATLSNDVPHFVWTR